MKVLLLTEWIKISRNRIFWITLAVYIVTISLILLGIRSAVINVNNNVAEVTQGVKVLPVEIFKFPWVWHNLTFLAKFTKILLGILMILIVTNELTYNTLRQNIINGLSRREFVTAKLIDAIMLSIAATLIIFVFGLVAGFINTPFVSLSSVFKQLYFIAGYFLMLSGYLTMVMMFAVILKKAILTIATLVLYSLILEPIIAWKYEAFGQYLPGQVFNNFIIAPQTALFAILHVKTSSDSISLFNVSFTLLYIVIFYGITFYVLKKRDL